MPESGVRRCHSCGSALPEDIDICPWCGATVFISGEAPPPVRRIHTFYGLEIFHVQAKKPVIVDDEPRGFEVEWRLLLARPQLKAAPIFILERDGLVSPGRPEAALKALDKADLARILEELPRRKRKRLIRIIEDEWGVDIDEENLEEALRPYIYQSVPRLRDPEEALKGVDWRSYVERLACWKPGKPEPLVKVHTAKLLEPPAMKYAPHSIEITNTGVGKSAFYFIAGILIDKATRRSDLGYAESPKEIYPGSVNETRLPTAFDQIESQDSYALAKYMFQLMETGEALVDAGGVRFPVKTYSCFAYLGNPVSRRKDKAEAFQALLDHISFNPAIGRRFGIILYNTALPPIRGSDKLSLDDEEEWKTAFTLFRAVEEYCRPKLQRIIRHPRVVEWLHGEIPGYREAIAEAVRELEDTNIRLFLEAHEEAQHRVRGAALNTALALLLDHIALREVDDTLIEEIIQEAEEHLADYVNINLESVANLAQAWTRIRTDQAKAFYESAPDYLREIISAVLLYRRAHPEVERIELHRIPYQPESQEAYRYFSRCINKLRQRKRLDTLNERLKSFYGFQLVRADGDFIVEYFDDPKPPEDLELIGSLNHLTDLTISPPPKTGVFHPQASLEGSEDREEDNDNASLKMVKRLNWLNGEKWTQSLSKEDRLVARIVEKHGSLGVELLRSLSGLGEALEGVLERLDSLGLIEWNRELSVVNWRGESHDD